MWPTILSLVLNFTPGSVKPEGKYGTETEIKTGVYFSDLTPDLQEAFRETAHKDVTTWDDRHFHMFALWMKAHPGYYYTVVFDSDWRIYKVTNSWDHKNE